MGNISKRKKEELNKLTVQWFNPSLRKLESVEVEEIYTGVLRYKDEGDDFECLVGIETKATNTGNLLGNSQLHPGHKRRITHLCWDTSSHISIGKRIQMCPRDIAIAYAVITYLKKKGLYIP